MPDVVHVVGRPVAVLPLRGVAFVILAELLRDRETVLNAPFESTWVAFNQRERTHLVVLLVIAWARKRSHVQPGPVVPQLGRTRAVQPSRHQLPLNDVRYLHGLVKVLFIFVELDVLPRA